MGLRPYHYEEEQSSQSFNHELAEGPAPELAPTGVPLRGRGHPCPHDTDAGAEAPATPVGVLPKLGERGLASQPGAAPLPQAGPTETPHGREESPTATPLRPAGR